IRDDLVTGVQTCALPILVICAETDTRAADLANHLQASIDRPLDPSTHVVGSGEACARRLLEFARLGVSDFIIRAHPRPLGPQLKIGRASCREGVQVWVVM